MKATVKRLAIALEGSIIFAYPLLIFVIVMTGNYDPENRTRAFFTLLRCLPFVFFHNLKQDLDHFFR